jgi:hypothetical protein
MDDPRGVATELLVGEDSKALRTELGEPALRQLAMKADLTADVDHWIGARGGGRVADPIRNALVIVNVPSGDEERLGEVERIPVQTEERGGWESAGDEVGMGRRVHCSYAPKKRVMASASADRICVCIVVRSLPSHRSQRWRPSFQPRNPLVRP